MIVKIISADPTVLSWKSLKKKRKNIQKCLGTMKNVGNVEVEVVSRPDLVPRVSNGRIVHSFLESLSKEYTKDGEATIVFHMSEEQHAKWGIKPTLRGSAFNDDNFFSEAYVWADETTKRRGYNQFEETTLHEISHLLCYRMGIKDLTHEWHDHYGTIKALFKQYDYRTYQKNLITKISNWIANFIGPSKLQPLVERKSQLVIAEMAKLGYTVHVFEGYRSIARQNELYAQGRTTPGNIVTKAKGGESIHNYGAAVDIVFGPKGKPSWNPKEPWDKLGEVGKKYGFEWGGDWEGFSDLPHLEMRLGYKLSEFQNKKVDYNKFL